MWDRLPVQGPIERLVPNDNSIPQGARAAKVEKDERRCFGDGTDGYYLFMDPADGLGRGYMWLVFTESEEQQPSNGRYSDSAAFQEGFERVGAGSMSAMAAPSQGSSRGEACEPRDALRYPYEVR